MRRICILMFCLLWAAPNVKGEETATEPVIYKMQLIYIFEDGKTGYIFAIGQSGFKSLEKLKEWLKHLPKRSIVEWNPGGKRTGGEPLLSNEKDMGDFKKFCAESGIEFHLIPGE